MFNDDIENTVLNFFQKKSHFTKSDLVEYYSNKGIVLTDEGFRSKLYRWRKKGIIHDIANGKYVINNKSVFVPQSDEIIKKINKLYISKYDDVDYCIWSTSWLSNYMHHIPFYSFYVIETEKDICESTFYLLKDNGINAYYNPNTEQIEKYVLPEDDSVIVRNLISRSPGKKFNDIRFPSIEKILVDIFCDQDVFFLHSGREQKWIFENILKAYNINFSTLLSYAERRKREKELREYLLKNFDDIVEEIIG
ncbi:MAG: hypothetical protein HOD63_05120 [Bacteroidetes bacterium]|jgi:hypothetical protein|nr:hypothetical protein [Bacteroidota bacterium]MBT5529882.1 hypothetical protein [Cytophagia bacterium]MBT3800549.1 hypothetical protein [Bacteroidota bacterium]MBT3935302.1 hypothetical protein [Bacteroidota bacterium]MBT4337947.1 hypothetical protein [Bacteroidota bacterium]